MVTAPKIALTNEEITRAADGVWDIRVLVGFVEFWTQDVGVDAGWARNRNR